MEKGTTKKYDVFQTADGLIVRVDDQIFDQQGIEWMIINTTDTAKRDQFQTALNALKNRTNIQVDERQMTIEYVKE